MPGGVGQLGHKRCVVDTVGVGVEVAVGLACAVAVAVDVALDVGDWAAA